MYKHISHLPPSMYSHHITSQQARIDMMEQQPPEYTSVYICLDSRTCSNTHGEIMRNRLLPTITHDTQHKPRLYRPQQHAQDVVAHQQMYSSPQPKVNQQYRVRTHSVCTPATERATISVVVVISNVVSVHNIRKL